MDTDTELNRLLEAGDEFLAGGLPDRALAAFDAALVRQPASLPALTGKARALARLGRLAEAKRYLQFAARRCPDEPQIWLLQGRLALAAGDGREAREAFVEHQRLAGTSAAGLLDLAVASYYCLDREQAVNYIDLALLADPESEEANAWQRKLESLADEAALLVEVGRAHCREGRFDQGQALLEQAVERGNSADAQFYLAGALNAAGQYEEAAKHLEALLQHAPDHVEAMRVLAGTLLLLDREDEAEALYHRLLQLQVDNVDALIGKAQALLARDHTDEAKATADRAVGADPDRPDAWAVKGEVLLAAGETAESRACLERAIALNRREPSFWISAARPVAESGDEALARRYVAMARYLQTGEAAAQAALDAAGLAPIDEEIATLFDLAEKDADHRQAFLDRARIYDDLDLPQRALDLLDASLEKWPGEGTERTICERGVLLLNMGRNEEARETFRKALQRNAESEPAREGLEIAEERILQGSAASP